MKTIISTFALAILCFAGCNEANVEVVDLNKVLDVFQATLDRLDGEDKEAAQAEALEPVAEEDQEKTKTFADAFAKDLNEAKLLSKPIGVEVAQSGTIEGFQDLNKDNQRAAGELTLFTIDVDQERGRVIASDTAGHNRDHQYRPRFGMFTGYMLGSMMGRSNNYYSGARASLKPDFSSKQMSPKSYHASAVSKARTSARAARSRSGSKGFSFGK